MGRGKLTLEQEGTVDGTVKSIVFRNDENGYSILKVSRPAPARGYGAEEEISVLGTCVAVWEGEELHAEGVWVEDPVHGRQFKAKTIQCIPPKSAEGIRRYLASGLIHGIGPVLANRIVDHFGDATIEVLDHHSERLKEIDKVGEKKLASIRKGWKEGRGTRELMIFTQTYGISVAKTAKIYRRYGPDSIAVIKADPYRLCRDIWGIGFATADKIALSVGIPAESPLRARASISYALEAEAEDGGHCWTFENDLLLRANELTGISVEVLACALREEVEAARVVSVDGRIALRRLASCERQVARFVRGILSAPRSFPGFDASRAIAWWQSRAGFTLATSQREALERSLSSKFSIITGGPGVGKTTIIRALVEICGVKKLEVVLAAPTGRAAKRMTESVGAQAQTIHRLLKWNPATNKFTYDAENRLEGDVFIFDETSMIDVTLAADLLAAIPPAATVVWVGDTDQLPSVGAGSVLGDLIKSGAVPSTRLDIIFRQDTSGLIVRNAHHVNAGEPLEVRRGEDSDFYFLACRDPQKCLALAIEFMTERIPRKFGMNPLEDVQVLVPMRRNLLGTDSLNAALQQTLNPRGEGLARGGTTFRVGDRVMQLRNNYDKDVYNGDIGFVKAVSPEERKLVVAFDGRPVRYEPGDLDELVLAYATTIHKSQGSEYPAVVILIHTQHYVMLQRNLLYTAITRGRKLVLLMGVPYAVDRAIKTNTVRERRTTLAERLSN